MTTDKRQVIRNKKPTIIILHGWGLRGSIYKELIELLEDSGFVVFSLDLPGFGSEKLKKQAINLEDYATFVKKFMDREKLKKAVLIGHSFGGRVAIKFVLAYPNYVKAIILTGAPGIKQKLSLVKKTARYLAIFVSEIFRFRLLLPLKQILRKGLYFIIGEWDYYKAGDLRETFKKVIAEDLAPLLSKIAAPTLIIWGQKDRVVPLSVARQMSQRIPNSKLAIIEDSGHKVPYENPKAFFKACLPFLRQLV